MIPLMSSRGGTWNKGMSVRGFQGLVEDEERGLAVRKLVCGGEFIPPTEFYILCMFLKKLKRILKASKVWAVNFTVIKMTISKQKML